MTWTALSLFFKTRYKLILWGIIAALAVALCWQLIGIGKTICENDQKDTKILALETALAAEREYLRYILEAAERNRSFVERQKKALTNAKEADAPAAPVLRNTLARLHDADRPD